MPLVRLRTAAREDPIRLRLMHERALEVARTQIGEGEEGHNNAGPIVEMYQGNRRWARGEPWCAWFVHWCFLQAATDLDIRLPLKPTGNAKRLCERVAKVGRWVDRPLPGDLVLWHRGRMGSRKGHVGIVSRQTMWPAFASIEGNKGMYPSAVGEFPHDSRDDLMLVGFARLW